MGSTEGQRPCHPIVADGDDAGDHGERDDQLREHRNHRNDIIPSRSPSASSLWGCFWLVCGGCRQEGFGVGFASALRSVHASHFGYTPKKRGGEEGLLHALIVFIFSVAELHLQLVEEPLGPFQDVQPRGVFASLQTRLLDSNKHEFEAEGDERGLYRGAIAWALIGTASDGGT